MKKGWILLLPLLYGIFLLISVPLLHSTMDALYVGLCLIFGSAAAGLCYTKAGRVCLVISALFTVYPLYYGYATIMEQRRYDPAITAEVAVGIVLPCLLVLLGGFMLLRGRKQVQARPATESADGGTKGEMERMRREMEQMRRQLQSMQQGGSADARPVTSGMAEGSAQTEAPSGIALKVAETMQQPSVSEDKQDAPAPAHREVQPRPERRRPARDQILLIVATALFAIGVIAICIGYYDSYYYLLVWRRVPVLVERVFSIYGVVSSAVCIAAFVTAHFVRRNKAILFTSAVLSGVSLVNGLYSVVRIFQEWRSQWARNWPLASLIRDYVMHYDHTFGIWNNFIWLISAVLLCVYLFPKAIRGLKQAQEKQTSGYEYLDQYKQHLYKK